MNERTLEVLCSPAEFAALKGRDLSETLCVVFDVLRATSTMITALANGAAAIIPVEEIGEALAWRKASPDVLLAGERDGLRITAALTGGIDFDLGNSPREFTEQKVRPRTIVITTTNGTRALRACRGAHRVLVGSFLNLTATAKFILEQSAARVLIVGSGTYEEAAYEDVLGAGALCELLWGPQGAGPATDSAHMARRLYQLEQADLRSAMARSRNARRLLARAQLSEDVAFSLRRDHFDLVAEMEKDGVIRVAGAA